MAGRHRAPARVIRTMLAVAVPVVFAAAVATAVVLGSTSVSAGSPTVAVPTFPSQERVLAANVVAVSAAPFAVHHSSDMAGGAVSEASTAVVRRADEQRAAEERSRADEQRAEATARPADRTGETSERAATPRPTTAPRPSTSTPPPETRETGTPEPTSPDVRARSASPEPTEPTEPTEDADEPGGLLDGALFGEGSLLGH